jgi:hypothetical protein
LNELTSWDGIESCKNPNTNGRTSFCDELALLLLPLVVVVVIVVLAPPLLLAGFPGVKGAVV